MASFDVIIVGGGTAGCVLANRLSATSRLSILLVEAGPDNNSDPKVSTPGLSRRMFNDPVYDWGFRTVPQSGLNGRIIEPTRGRMIGGSSAINSHSLVYPNRAMHQAWAQIAGDERWSWERMGRFYKSFHTVQPRATDNQRDLETGKPLSDGPVQASYPRHMHILQNAWEDVFRSLGAYASEEDSSGLAIGGLTATNAIDGRSGKGERSHSGNSFLALAAERSNLRIVTDARVERLIIQEEGSHTANPLRVTGVVYEKDGAIVSMTANKEVILCAGVFGSPQILELSGIGSRTVLENAGVQCLHDLAGVGENLQDHLNYGPSVEVNPDIETTDEVVRNPALAAAQKKEYEEHRTGPLSEGAAYSFAHWPLQLFNSTTDDAELRELLDKHYNAELPTYRSHYDFIREMILDPGEASATVFMIRLQKYTTVDSWAPGNYMTVVAMLAHPFSRGSSHIQSASSREAPLIDFNYLSHPLDAEVLARHAMQVERLLEQPTFAPILKPGGNRLPREFNYRPHSLEDAKRAIRQHGATNYHPCGTCAMATAERGGVVDGELRVYGVRNLRICDASIFPIIPRGNILSAVYAAAENAAEIFLASYV